MQDFLKNQRDNIAMIAGVAMPMLLMAGGMAVDYGRAHSAKASLQSAGDAAAIGGAKELMLSNADASQVSAAVKSIVDAHISGSNSTQRAVRAEAKVIKNGTAVEVTLQERQKNVFGGFLNPSYTDIVVASVAEFSGGTNVCVIGLNPTNSATVSLTMESRLEANECAVYSNSTSSTGMSSYKNSLLQAELICSAGGTGGGSSNFNPGPVTDCPPVTDPLAHRAPPAVGTCDYNNYTLSNSVETLSPGVYCGGLGIYGTSDVTLEPGIYVMKDGPLQVTQTSSVRGEQVGFYLTGSNAIFLFAGGSSVELSAPIEGPMAGLLFFEDRSAPLGRHHEIVSENARKLVGTIYLPKGNFLVSSKKPVADLSAYTAIIAQSVQLHKYPYLIINSDYGSSDVPVPDGLTSSGGQIRLTD